MRFSIFCHLKGHNVLSWQPTLLPGCSPHCRTTDQAPHSSFLWQYSESTTIFPQALALPSFSLQNVLGFFQTGFSSFLLLHHWEQCWLLAIIGIGLWGSFPGFGKPVPMSDFPKAVAFSECWLSLTDPTLLFQFLFPASLLHTTTSPAAPATWREFRMAHTNSMPWLAVALGRWRRCNSTAPQPCKRGRMRPVGCVAESGRLWECFVIVILIQHYEESPNGWLAVNLWCCVCAWLYLGKMQWGQLTKLLTHSFSTCFCFSSSSYFSQVFFSSFSFPILPFIFPFYYL